ncbi:SWIM zinc finger family protein, partial [Streptomyces sp. CO7]
MRRLADLGAALPGAGAALPDRSAAADGPTVDGPTADDPAAGRTSAGRTSADRSTPDGSTPDGSTPDGSTPDGSTADRTPADRTSAYGSTAFGTPAFGSAGELPAGRGLSADGDLSADGASTRDRPGADVSAGDAVEGRPAPRPSGPPRTPVQDTLPHDDPAPAARPRGVGAELRKTFDRLPPREQGAALAGTPWGEAWITALTERALDPARLARGRRYAEEGRVDSVTVTPGLVLAYVHGSRPRPYRAQVRVRTLDEDEWEAFLDAVAERPAHIAALLDRQLPEGLIEGGVGAPLLPRRGDLLPFCGCPDTGRPCKHAAALCYQTARLLDADPFALLLLRGRGEQEIL